MFSELYLLDIKSLIKKTKTFFPTFDRKNIFSLDPLGKVDHQHGELIWLVRPGVHQTGQFAGPMERVGCGVYTSCRYLFCSFYSVESLLLVVVIFTFDDMEAAHERVRCLPCYTSCRDEEERPSPFCVQEKTLYQRRSSAIRSMLTPHVCRDVATLIIGYCEQELEIKKELFWERGTPSKQDNELVWCGMYTSGYSWCRGTHVNAPTGDEWLYDGLRGKSPSVVIAKLQRKNRFTLLMTYKEYSDFAVQTQIETNIFDGGEEYEFSESESEDLLPNVEGATYLVDIERRPEDRYCLIEDIDLVIEELREVQGWGVDHGVKFTWV